MNFGRGLPISQENGNVQNRDSWFLVTPEKPISLRSNPAPVDMQRNQLGIGNWQELIGMYSDILNHDEAVQTSNSTVGINGGNPNRNGVAAERNQHFNRNTHSFVHNLSNDNAGRRTNSLAELLGIKNTEIVASANGTWNKSINVSNRPTNSNSYTQAASKRMEPEYSTLMLAKQNYILGSTQRLSNSNSYAQVASNWTASKSTSLMLEKQNCTLGSNKRLANFNSFNQVASNWTESESASLMLAKQDCTLDSSQRLTDSSLTQLPDDGSPIPYWPNYNLNSPPRPELDAALSITSSFNFAPVTPDQAKQLEHRRLSERLNVSLDESSSQEKEKQWNVVTSTSGEIENHSNELSQIIVDSASAVISTPLKETNISYEEGEQGIDLNKTPEQKTPKRRKHRPKVVIEGKPKRVRKAATPKTNVSNDNQSGKRKYVRKKGLKTPESQQENIVSESTLPTVESSQKSCRRVLNFDLETITIDASHDRTDSNQAGRHEENKRPFNLNLNSDETEICTGISSTSGTSAGQIKQARQPNEYTKKNQKTVSTCNLTCSTNQMPSEYKSLTEQSAPTKPPAKAKDHTLNVIARNVNMRNAIPGQNSGRNGYNQVHQHTHREEISQDVFQADSLSANFHRTRKLMLQNTTQLVVKDVANSHEKRGFKRAHCQIVEQIHPHTQNLMGSPILSQGNLCDNRNSGSSNDGTIVSETHKKMSTKNGLNANISYTPSTTKAARDCSREVDTGGLYIMYANNGTSQINGRLLSSCFERDDTSKSLSDALTGTSGDWCIAPMATKQKFQRQQASFTIQANRGQMADGVYQLKAPTSDCQQGIKTCDPSMSTKQQTLKPSSLNQGSRRVQKVLQQQQSDALEGYQQSPLKARGKLTKQKLPLSVEEITYLLEGLHIDGRNSEVVAQEQHALVPYYGSSTIVPYEGFDHIKKRKPRPKVDLDPETDRIWKLLMGSEGRESTEASDKDKEKWWEEERKVFRGRADSFIARMHLVQGDRRFSRWKGSVVDSVIGVFLTQNVSDHLSSSAFMSLAARFPLQSYLNGTCVLVEEPDLQVVESNGSINVLSSRTKSAEKNDYNRISNAEFNLSQNSFDPIGFRTSEEIISSSRSNSKADRRTGFNPDMNYSTTKKIFQTKETVPTDSYSHVNGSSLLDERSTQWHQQSEDPRLGRFNNLRGFSAFPYPINSDILLAREPILSSRDFQLNMTPESGVQDKCYFGLPGEESITSFAPTHSGITNVKGVNHMSRWMRDTAGSTLAQQNGVPSVQAPMLDPFAFLGKHPTQQGYQQTELHPRYNHHSTKNSEPEINKSFRLERTIVTEPVGPAIAGNESISGQEKQNCLDNKTEANAKEQSSSLKPFNGTGTNVPHAKKGKAEGEKKNMFDWDSLRKQAQSNGRRERSKETMDSLDYEALRCANVSEISNAIKERGMNNMLADRIKDFLNRLVNDHGSVDLEWLRDVPPDKAKDYLLSIRGLGLKSVECVRLLTLHQLAFPVDTNVGRIAVRLGWVPLQTLPESLQLHLLELYPILESIQKYLWPRLCKLDQQTLYELHYQMITFGKVFCTKSKPNCNACPMRGECRHFASAFASARLALPGPEERSIVSSAVPIASESIPVTPMKLFPLLQAERETNIAGLINKRCEPIIEEPTTPEREIRELLESDIEDAFYEDPDEIPTIKLNIDEFALNLQNYIQDNMELQEGDMSRALVALNPEVASIPTPKLKNVSRLRTEHQVYELPDSHPLLKGLDKREPDDPSPYLLAIWTPGETANSVQSPESRCEIHESGQLCNNTTCFSCNSTREANSQTVRGTLLIPCRTAMKGSFPLNGTYFQVNEMFADHESSLNPIDVPRSLIWNLPRRTVYFGTSVTSIFKGLPTEGIQFCFWKGFVCVRGFDQKRRAPRPLMARLHFPASKLVKTKK